MPTRATKAGEGEWHDLIDSQSEADNGLDNADGFDGNGFGAEDMLESANPGNGGDAAMSRGATGECAPP